MDDRLILAPTVTVSTLRVQDPAECAAVLEQVLAVVRRRAAHLAEAGLTDWDGPRSTVVIAPSSEVLDSAESLHLAELLARTGRKSGVDVRLIDAQPTPSLYSCGSTLMRALVTDPNNPHVTFQSMTLREISELM